MSSPEYAELRGISGVAVTAKAALMDTPAKRSLLYFLQAMSLQPGKPGEPGGLQKFCADFLEMFPDRIGTPTMHKVRHEARSEIQPRNRAANRQRVLQSRPG